MNMIYFTIVILIAGLSSLPPSQQKAPEVSWNSLWEEASAVDYGVPEEHPKDRYMELKTQVSWLTPRAEIFQIDGRMLGDMFFARHGLRDQKAFGFFPGLHRIEVKRTDSAGLQFYFDSPVIIRFVANPNKTYVLENIPAWDLGAELEGLLPVVKDSTTGEVVSEITDLAEYTDSGRRQIISLRSKELQQTLERQQNPKAQYLLAYITLMASPSKEAVEAYSTAPEALKPEAYFSLGHIYFRGSGVPQDSQKALFWFEKAAGADFVPALDCLGLMYEHGIGVQQNPASAVKWYKEGVKRGSRIAASHLASLQENNLIKP
jgi:hypothetical protein